MLRLRLTEKDEGRLYFVPLNDKGQSKDFWTTGFAEGAVQLFDVMPITAAMFEVGKEYEVIIHEKHAGVVSSKS